MKTKIKPDQIDQEQQENRLTHRTFQKLFAKDIGRLKEGEVVRAVLFTKYDFLKKKRPLMIVGVNQHWKAFVKKEVKLKRKEFAVAEVQLKVAKPKSKIIVKLVKGKAKSGHVIKAFRKFPPHKGFEYVISNKDYVEEDESEEMGTGKGGPSVEEELAAQKGDFKVFGKDTFDKIKGQVAALRETNSQLEQKKLIPQILGLIETWVKKHRGSKKKTDQKKAATLAGLYKKLKTHLGNIESGLSHLSESEQEDAEYWLSLYKDIRLDFEQYKKNAKAAEAEQQLEDIHSMLADIEEWTKHFSKDLSDLEKKRQGILLKIKTKLEEQLNKLNARQNLATEMKTWEVIKKGVKDLGKISENAPALKLAQIRQLELKIARLEAMIK